MHIEVLVEDSSGGKLLDLLLPRILGDCASPITWRVKAYKGIGRIPKGLKPSTNASKRILLDQLPRLLSGYGKTPWVDAVVVVLDTDRQDCTQLLGELKHLAAGCDACPRVLFRLAVEEIEAWYFGDRNAILRAYPHAKKNVLDRYQQDAVCDTWETLADAIYKGGSTAVGRIGWPLSGQLKHEWAEKIGPHMNIEANMSPSFKKLRDGLRRLAAENE